MPREGEPPLFFRVNGVRIFAKGANYLHARALSFATQGEERRHALFLLDAARDAHLNVSAAALSGFYVQLSSLSGFYVVRAPGLLSQSLNEAAATVRPRVGRQRLSV